MSATTDKKPEKAKRPPFHEEFANKIIERLQEGNMPPMCSRGFKF
jgi:hypothetical protein